MFLRYVLDDCSTVPCDFGGTCKTVEGLAKCECDFACADDKNAVCGSDGKTYSTNCELQKEQCAEQRTINLIKNEPCGESMLCSVFLLCCVMLCSNHNKNIIIFTGQNLFSANRFLLLCSCAAQLVLLLVLLLLLSSAQLSSYSAFS